MTPAMARADVPGECQPHGLRRTAITLAFMQGHGMREVQKFARHSEPKTTVGYDMLANSQNNVSHALAGWISQLAE